MGAKGAPRTMNTKGAVGKNLSTLHPNTILKPNLDSNAHSNPQPTPDPTSNPNQDWILGPSWWGKEHRQGDFNDN